MGHRVDDDIGAGDPPHQLLGETREFRPGPDAPTPSEPGPFMSLHTALVLLIAVVIGLIVGGLSFLSGTSAAGAVLAGLISTGGSVPVLRTLIG